MRDIVPNITDTVTVVTQEQLIALCNVGFSLSYLIDGKGSMFNRSTLGMELRQKQFEKHLYEMLDSNFISTPTDTVNFSPF